MLIPSSSLSVSSPVLAAPPDAGLDPLVAWAAFVAPGATLDPPAFQLVEPLGTGWAICGDARSEAEKALTAAWTYLPSAK